MINVLIASTLKVLFVGTSLSLKTLVSNCMSCVQDMPFSPLIPFTVNVYLTNDQPNSQQEFGEMHFLERSSPQCDYR